MHNGNELHGNAGSPSFHSLLHDTEWNDITALSQQDNGRYRLAPSWMYEPWSSTPLETPLAPVAIPYDPSGLQDPSPEFQFYHTVEGYWDEYNSGTPTVGVHIEEPMAPRPIYIDSRQSPSSVHTQGHGTGAPDEPQVVIPGPSPIVPDFALGQTVHTTGAGPSMASRPTGRRESRASRRGSRVARKRATSEHAVEPPILMEDGRRYCRCCDGTYGRMHEWRRAHSGVNFQCPVCDDVLARDDALKRHIRTQHPESEFASAPRNRRRSHV